MQISTQGGVATPRVRQPLAVLTALAKRDCALELILKADGSRELRVLKGGAPCSSKAVLAYSAFVAARDLGWLADAEGSGLRWTLSQEGRVALRRVRSAGEGTISPVAGTVTMSGSQTCVDAAESPLSWLRRRKDKSGQPMITAVQFDAGERLRGDLWFAQMTPRVTANWSGTGGSGSRSGGGLGIDIRDNVAAAQQRVRRAMAAVGPMPAGLLLDVCGHLLGLEQVERARGWPPRSGKIGLQMALCALARHYGLQGAEAAPAPLASRLRHWGVEDYRPSAEGAE